VTSEHPLPVRNSEQFIEMSEAIEAVEWARNSGDGSVSTDLVDNLTDAVHRFVGFVEREIAAPGVEAADRVQELRIQLDQARTHNRPSLSPGGES
jgi:hypothetical protein